MTDPDTDADPDPYRDTGKICLGEGMHCPSASSFILSLHCIKTEHLMCNLVAFIVSNH